MKKVTIATILVFLLAIGSAFAQNTSNANGNLNGLSIGYNSSSDYDSKSAFGGYTSGSNGPNFGLAITGTHGHVTNGKIKSEISATGGAISNTVSDNYTFNPENGWGKGVYTTSYTDAITAGGVKLYGKGSKGSAIGCTIGLFKESNTASSNISYSSNGYSNAKAQQDANGLFIGCAKINFSKKNRASVESSIETVGTSYANSYKFTTNNGDLKTRGIGSSVEAKTLLTSHGKTKGNSLLIGGWSASGDASSSTYQTNNGITHANTYGNYSGTGYLGQNYMGSATGYTYSQVTTMQGANGSINVSGASMTVTSIIK